MNKKKILIIGNGCNNNYIKKILENNYEIIVVDETDYSNLKGYEFGTVFIDEYVQIKQLKQFYDMDNIEEKELVKKEKDKIQKHNMIAGMKGYKSKKYKRYF